jgi:hypothetical protein
MIYWELLYITAAILTEAQRCIPSCRQNCLGHLTTSSPQSAVVKGQLLTVLSAIRSMIIVPSLPVSNPSTGLDRP